MAFEPKKSVELFEELLKTHNSSLWCSELNEKLYQEVVSNLFNFKMISKQIINYAFEKNLCSDASQLTEAECRLHWAFLHLKRSLPEATLKSLMNEEKIQKMRQEPESKIQETKAEHQEITITKTEKTELERINIEESKELEETEEEIKSMEIEAEEWKADSKYSRENEKIKESKEVKESRESTEAILLEFESVKSHLDEYSKDLFTALSQFEEEDTEKEEKIDSEEGMLNTEKEKDDIENSSENLSPQTDPQTELHHQSSHSQNQPHQDQSPTSQRANLYQVKHTQEHQEGFKTDYLNAHSEPLEKEHDQSNQITPSSIFNHFFL